MPDVVKREDRKNRLTLRRKKGVLYIKGIEESVRARRDVF